MVYVCDDNFDCEDGYDEDREVCTAGKYIYFITISFLQTHNVATTLLNCYLDMS